ncbi:hypothetical protein MPRM_38500 [Mycobacterium parmense]|uniref:HEAT repeat-containing protein n=1 Tax=Mycobacterium parmense TaxID=185642 RepID=A0A7I7YY23_9MYCO|nr:hypothetical protein MPRM_38500 [Mycobacterium parmense]
MTASTRILQLLELSEEGPALEDLAEFLSDGDPAVRRNALSVLSECTEDDEWAQAAPYFAAALSDPSDEVRAAAMKLLRELVEVIEPGAEFVRHLRRAAAGPDPGVRASAIEALWRHRISGEDELRSLFDDPDETVRCSAVLGFVSIDSLDALAVASADAASAVRLAAARGFAAVGDPRGVTALLTLAGDTDEQVRAAALDAFGALGCTGDAVTVAAAALREPSWQVRQSAARALGSAEEALAAECLVAASADDNLDVRKAAVQSLAGFKSESPRIRDALRTATSDPDADVRAYARMGL